MTHSIQKILPQGISLKIFLPIILTGFFLTGCASPSLYYWGNYEEGLYVNLVKSNPEKSFSILSKTVAKAEKGKLNLAPGLYAEYGFLLYQQGKGDLAVQYFRKEADTFPESSHLMNRLIDRIKSSHESNDTDTTTEDNSITTPDS